MRTDSCAQDAQRSCGCAATSGCARRSRARAERPRLVVFRSLKHIYAQLVDDDRGVTLLGVSDTERGRRGRRRGQGRRAARRSGKLLAEKAKAAGSPRWCSTAAATVTMAA